MKIKTSIVLGTSFGDEGKGLMTDYLCSRTKNPLNVRFSGGHQCGHTVTNKNGTRHIFSQFGSGTLRGANTFYSRYCTFYPTGWAREREALVKLGMGDERFYVDTLAPVTTPYDLFYNRALEDSRRTGAHGSVGVGFGATIERHTLTPYKLYAQDLLFEPVLRQKLNAIKEYYWQRVKGTEQEKYYSEDNDLGKALSVFLESVDYCKEFLHIQSEGEFKFHRYDQIVFEGSQGILLDMDFGFFPNVTRSNTTSKNAIEIMNRIGLSYPEIYYVTRAYQTRHGNGWMSNENHPSLKLKNTDNETNKKHDYQGEFRKGLLDLDLLNYAITCDSNFSFNSGDKHLVITCLDQLDDDFLATKNGKEISVSNGFTLLENITSFKPRKIFKSYSDCSDKMKVDDLFNLAEAS